MLHFGQGDVKVVKIVTIDTYDDWLDQCRLLRRPGSQDPCTSCLTLS